VKRFITGLITGVLIALPISVFADGMIGKQVQTVVPVKVDGEYLDVDAIGIEGRTFAPVRALADAFGKEVDWVNGEVVINTPETSHSEYTGLSREELEMLLRSAQGEILIRQNSYEIENNRYENDPSEQNAYYLQAAKYNLEIAEQRLSKVQEAIDALNDDKPAE